MLQDLHDEEDWVVVHFTFPDGGTVECMDQTLDELKAKRDKAAIGFLKADLDLGFTFARLSQTEKGLDAKASQHAKNNALRAIETVKHFESHVRSPDHRKEIQDRLLELERFVATL